MNPSNETYIINLLLSLNDHHLFNDGDLFGHLKALSENFHSEDAAKKAQEDASKFIDFYNKTSLVNPNTVVKAPSGTPLRVYVDGVFDMVHSGHFNAIRQAKLLCDVLVVGVVSDEEVVFHKGPPVMDLAERAELIGACKWVDELVTDNIPYNPTIELIDKLNCQYVAHGDDLALSADGEDCYSIIKKAGRMKTFKRTQGISTTDIVGRLLLVARNPERKQSKDLMKKLSSDDLVTSKSIENAVAEESKETADVPRTQLLQTTRRIRQFSSGKEPKPTDKIVYIDGTFDLLHIGHIRILKKAKEQGDFLIVGLHDDETVEKHKGKNYPVLHLQERVLNILALKYVDEVIIGAPWKINENMIKNLNISVVVEGMIGPISETEAQTISENDPYEIPKQLGIYKKLESTSQMTTEGIIRRIIENRNKLAEAFEIKKKKLENYYKTQDTSVKEA